jgi:tripartite-type tricarboxylate transporter receptor subunit TctC
MNATRHIASVILTAGMLMAGASFAQDSAAQAYPSKPIKLLVPITAGGGTDILARAVGQELQRILGKPVIVENRPGANGTIGTQLAAQAAPDGHTILVGSIGTHGVNEYLYRKLPYDPVKDFEPVTLLAKYNNVIVVAANSPIRSLKELVQQAKQQPGVLNYGITVIGSSSHLAVEKFKSDASIKVQDIPYNGAMQATTDMIGGRTHFMFDTVVSQYGQIEGKKVRAIATTALKRSPALPDVPTVAEQGYPGFDVVGWTGLFVPAGTPASITEKIAAAVKKAFESPEMQRTGSRGVELVATTPREFGEFAAQERIKWAKVIKQANITLE